MTNDEEEFKSTQKMLKLLKEWFGLDISKIKLAPEVRTEIDNQLRKVTQNIGRQVIDMTGGLVIDFDPSMVRESLVEIFDQLDELTNPQKPKTFLAERFAVVENIQLPVVVSWVEDAITSPRTSDPAKRLYEASLKALDKINYIKRLVKDYLKGNKTAELESQLMTAKLAFEALLRLFAILERKK